MIKSISLELSPYDLIYNISITLFESYGRRYRIQHSNQQFSDQHPNPRRRHHLFSQIFLAGNSPLRKLFQRQHAANPSERHHLSSGSIRSPQKYLTSKY